MEDKENSIENEINTTDHDNNTKKQISDSQKELEELYAAFELAKKESKDAQMRAKEIKEEIIAIMNEKGYDEIIINGLDSLVVLSITFPEREVLNKKALAEVLNVTQKELSKPEVIVQLVKAGKLSAEMIAEHTEVEERMQFSAQEYNPNYDQ